MNFNEYQKKAISTAIYPKEHKVIYPTLGLTGEAGEVAEKVKKVMRDNGGIFTPDKICEIRKELGDVLWYIANIAEDLDIDLSEIAERNIGKLFRRKENNTLQGSGDNR